MPRTLDDTRGLRVARWIRESAAGPAELRAEACILSRLWMHARR